MQNKAEFYETVVRYGFYLPKFKSSIITGEYIYDVLCGRVMCPKYADLKLLPCPRPPGKDVLIKHANSVASQYNKPIGIDGTHEPDMQWLLAFLATYSPNLTIFSKDYTPPARIQKIETKATAEVPHDFIQGLPKRHRKKVRHTRLGIISKAKVGARLDRIKQQKEKFTKLFVEAEEKVTSSKQRDASRAEGMMEHLKSSTGLLNTSRQ